MKVHILKEKILALLRRLKQRVLKHPKLLIVLKFWLIANFTFGLLFGGTLGAYIGIALYPLFYDSLGPVFSIFVPVFTTGILAVGFSFGFLLASVELAVPLTAFALALLTLKERMAKGKQG